MSNDHKGAQSVTFTNKAGLKLAGLLELPDAERPPIVIISPVLRGDKQYSPIMDRASRELAQAGYAVLRYDVTGFGDSEGRSEDMTITSQAEDLGQTITYARSLPVDSSRIGLIGFSIGSTCDILNANQDGVKALALWSPALSLQSLAERYAPRAAEVAAQGYFESGAFLTGRHTVQEELFLKNAQRLILQTDLEN